MHSEYEFSPVAAESRRGFWAMLAVMVGFTFFSASMWAGATLGTGLRASSFLLAVLAYWKATRAAGTRAAWLWIVAMWLALALAIMAAPWLTESTCIFPYSQPANRRPLTMFSPPSWIVSCAVT